MSTQRLGGHAFWTKRRFMPASNRFAAIVLLGDARDPDVYLVPSTEWRAATPPLTDRPNVGKRSEPEYGISLVRSSLPALQRYAWNGLSGNQHFARPPVRLASGRDAPASQGEVGADPGSVSRDTMRLVAFDDAVFAITITLLVLEIRPPPDDKNLLHGLVALWPSYLAYAVTFLFIGQVWANHHAGFRSEAKVRARDPEA